MAFVALVLALAGQALAPSTASAGRTQATATTVTHANDWDGDGSADVLAVDTAGYLRLYPGDGSGGWHPPRRIGTGWSGLDQIRFAGNWNSSGGTDVVARSKATGDLWLYPGTGSGRFGTPRRIGTGWQGFSVIIAPGDWTGDGRPDLLAVHRALHTLFLYPGDGAGGFGAARQIGWGWQTRDRLTAVGDWDGNGTNDFVAVDPSTGALWLYAGNGTGGFGHARVIGSGWSGFTALLGPGDWNGDGGPDLLARTQPGNLVLYRGTGTGGFLAPYPVVGTRWAGLVIGGTHPGVPPYAFSIEPISAAQMPFAHRAECPVRATDLRLVTVRHVGFDGAAHTGRLVVHSSVASAAARVFEKLYAARFPIERIAPVDAYGGSDDRSMAANNTSAYNCRRVTAGTSWSEHSYGTAIDINPVQNPYVSGATVLPAAGTTYLDRSARRPGMIVMGDVVTAAFAAEGWSWGGAFRSLKDYQHFSASGR